jgi:hypothetical protein
MLKRSSLLALGFTVLAAPWYSVSGGAAPADALAVGPGPGPVVLAPKAKADLVPISPPNSLYFCKSVSGQLMVAVRVLNQGGTFAPASSTTVDFFDGRDPIPHPIQGINPGSYLDMDPIPLSESCYLQAGDCVFKITVGTSGNQYHYSVDESNYWNNSAPGVCIG